MSSAVVAEVRDPISPRAMRVLLIGSLCSFQTALNVSVMNVAFPSLRADFSTVTASDLSWVLSAYTIVGAATFVPAGVIARRYGHKRTTLTGLTLFTVGSLLGALSPNVPVLIGARVIQAAGGSAIGPATVALIVDEFPPSRRTFAVSSWSGLATIASAIGPSLGALLIGAGGWRWAFWMSVPIGLIALTAGTLIFREWSDPQAPRLPDAFSVAALLVGVSLVTLAVVEAHAWGPLSGRILVAAACGVALVGWVVWRSAHVERPLLEVGLFRYRTFRKAAASALLFGIGFFALFFGAFQFLTFVWGFGTLKAGMWFLILPAVIALMSPVAGRASERFGEASLLLVAGLAMIAGALTLLIGAGPTASLALWAPAAVLLGIASGLAFPATYSLVVAGLPATMVAVAMSLQQTLQRIAGVLGVAIAIGLTAGWKAGDGVGSYALIWWVVGISGLATALLGLGRFVELLGERRR